MGDRIFNGVFGAFFGFCSMYLVAAMFSNRLLAKVRWGKGGGGPPISRLSIVVCLPFTSYISIKRITIALGHEWPWSLPMWPVILWIAFFILCSVRDSRKARSARSEDSLSLGR
jgi:hypothetical protein